MIVVSMRKFRASQSKYLDLANSGEKVLLTSRKGNFHLTAEHPHRKPVSTGAPREETEDERIMRLNNLTAEELREIREGLEEAKAGLGTPIRDIHNIWADIP